MRKTTLVFTAIVLCISCNDASKNDVAKTDSTSSMPGGNVSLAYTTKDVPDWERGSEENVAIAMNALKSFETNNFDGIRQHLADSVAFYTDYWEFKGTADSLISEMKKHRSTYSNITIKMEDYESVKSKKTGDEYVSLWYQETSSDNKGKTDSVFCMDDIKIQNGKIKSIDSKLRHYPASRPM